MILTNKFNVTYNMKKINENFDIFLVENTSSKLDSTNILDMAMEQFQARSVQYTRGRKAYVLFDKKAVEEADFKKILSERYHDVTVRRVDLLNEDELKQFYYQKRFLLQLLVNSIRVPRLEGYTYNNLSGRLFYGEPKWRSTDKKTKKPYSFYFLEISFDAGMYLNLEVKTFRKKKHGYRGPYYIIDRKSGRFRRMLRVDSVPSDEWFAESAFDGSKNTVPYLDFSSFEHFQCCKLGIMERFLQDVEKYLGEYVTLHAEQREGDQSFTESKIDKYDLSETVCAQFLTERGVTIVDECQTETSKRIVNRLVYELDTFHGVTAQLGTLSPKMYNIQLIHSPEYYESNDLPDPYNIDTHGMIVQHMIEERHESLSVEGGDKESPVIHKILIELILKGEVRTGQIGIYNWKKLSANKEWTFVLRQKLHSEESDRSGFINAAGHKTWYRYQYDCLTVDQQGYMKFWSFNDISAAKDEFEERIRFVYDTYSDAQKRVKREVEALLFSDINNIHVIIKTREKTMPNTHAIWQGLKETNEKTALLTDVLIEAVGEFADLYPEQADYAASIVYQLRTSTGPVTKRDMKKMMNMRTKAGKQLNRFLHHTYDIWISPEIKDRTFKDDFMLENITDIKYYEDYNTDGEGIHSLNYYVGPRRNGLKLSVYNASIVRQVRAERVIEFSELLPLMAVDFVRIGQYTVLPFPYKYLREYQRSGIFHM